MGSPSDPVFYGCQPRAIEGFQVVFTNNGVELSWDDPGISAIDKYIIQLTDDGGLSMGPSRRSQGWHHWADIAGSNAGTTRHTLTGLRMNHTYGAWINAVDTRNDDDASNDRYYCMGRYAFIKTFNVHLPAITGLEGYSAWEDGPEQATLEWDNHPTAGDLVSHPHGG